MTEPGITYDGELTEMTEDVHCGMAMGGLGTGTLAIDRAGRFADIHVQNNWTDQRKRQTPAGSFISLHTESEGRSAGKVLQLEPVADLPAVDGLTYRGHFPFTHIDYRDRDLPCDVSLEAFSPFVPHDADASSVPLVFITLRLKNPGDKPVKAAAAVSWRAAISPAWTETYLMQGNTNTLVGGGQPGVLMGTRYWELRGSEYYLSGVPSQDVTFEAVADWWQAEPTRHKGGEWIMKPRNDEALAHWRTFLDTGRLPPQRGEDKDDGLGEWSYHQPVGAVAGSVDLGPREEKEIRFALSWYFPFHRPQWRQLYGHWYAERFPGGAREVAEWGIERLDNLRSRSSAWRALIDDSSLPPNVRAMLGEVVYVLPRITWWLDDGRFVTYESINCPLTNPVLLQPYIQPVMQALFPEVNAIELRNTADYQLESGEIPTFLGRDSMDEPRYRVFSVNDCCAYPLALYWAMTWGGDPEFVADMYPVLKKTLQWGKTLDQDGDGVPDSHGVDQGIDAWPMFGAVNYVADEWMAALRAGAKIAETMKDGEFATWCREAERAASKTAEEVLWNGDYYNLTHDPETGKVVDICFAYMFSGQNLASILDLGRTHPADRIAKSLDAVWKINVAGCRNVIRSGARPDGTADPEAVRRKREDGSSQSNSFCPAIIAPLVGPAMRFGKYDEGLALVEEAYDLVVNRAKEPWFGQLYFNAETAKHFYGVHYSDTLILWDVLHSVTGVGVNCLDRSLTLAPPRIPVKAPVFSKLFFGQVDFQQGKNNITLTLCQKGERPALIRHLRVRLPEGARDMACVEVNKEPAGIAPDADGVYVLGDVTIAQGQTFSVKWA